MVFFINSSAKYLAMLSKSKHNNRVLEALTSHQMLVGSARFEMIGQSCQRTGYGFMSLIQFIQRCGIWAQLTSCIQDHLARINRSLMPFG